MSTPSMSVRTDSSAEDETGVMRRINFTVSSQVCWVTDLGFLICKMWTLLPKEFLGVTDNLRKGTSVNCRCAHLKMWVRHRLLYDLEATTVHASLWLLWDPQGTPTVLWQVTTLSPFPELADRPDPGPTFTSVLPEITTARPLKPATHRDKPVPISWLRPCRLQNNLKSKSLSGDPPVPPYESAAEPRCWDRELDLGSSPYCSKLRTLSPDLSSLKLRQHL